jgi:hypothetical protein
MDGQPGLSTSGGSSEKISVPEPACPTRLAQIFKRRFL